MSNFFFTQSLPSNETFFNSKFQSNITEPSQNRSKNRNINKKPDNKTRTDIAYLKSLQTNQNCPIPQNNLTKPPNDNNNISTRKMLKIIKTKPLTPFVNISPVKKKTNINLTKRPLQKLPKTCSESLPKKQLPSSSDLDKSNQNNNNAWQFKAKKMPDFTKTKFLVKPTIKNITTPKGKAFLKLFELNQKQVQI